MNGPGDACAPSSGLRQTACPRCGEVFSCGAAAGATPCFCVAIELGADRLAELRSRYPDCLCATCLRALAADPGTAA